ncbi:MAG TPA: ABC transporter ATP-binding protein [Chloroflexia bacterium]|nr:ABC transporter ATP-binding protein [Chloroflexia bacterium]
MSVTQNEATTATPARVDKIVDPVINIENLHVSYGDVQAVRDLSLQVKQGEIFGLVGPNGAGKTTTLSAIEGIVRPTQGTVTVLGYNVQKDPTEVKKRLGISLQSTSFFDDLKVWELIRLYAGLYEVYLSKTQIMDLLTRFELQDKANVLAEQMSGGQQQRLALALAIANGPQIVILDEPTTGLDPQARRAVWDIVRALRNEGHTVLLTTHYMEEAEQLCNRVGIIDDGQLIALDTPGGLINSLKADSLISATIPVPLADVLELPSVTKARYDGDRLLIESSNAHASVMGLQRLAVAQEKLLTDLTIKQPDLEDVFIALTGKKIR